MHADDGPKDANEALKKGIDMQDLFLKSKTLSDKKMLQVSDLKSQLLFRLRNEAQLKGV